MGFEGFKWLLRDVIILEVPWFLEKEKLSYFWFEGFNWNIVSQGFMKRTTLSNYRTLDVAPVEGSIGSWNVILRNIELISMKRNRLALIFWCNFSCPWTNWCIPPCVLWSKFKNVVCIERKKGLLYIHTPPTELYSMNVISDKEEDRQSDIKIYIHSLLFFNHFFKIFTHLYTLIYCNCRIKESM